MLTEEEKAAAMTGTHLDGGVAWGSPDGEHF